MELIPKWGILNLLPCLIPILFFVSLCSSWFDLKVVCLYSFQKELDLTLTTVATIHMFRKISSPGNIGSGTSPSVFIFERIVILCFVSFLYIVKNFIQASQIFLVGGVHGEKKTGDQTFSWPWNMCFTELHTYLESWWWVIVKRFFFHYMG